MGQDGWHGEGLEGETLGHLSLTYAFLSALPGLTMASLNFEKGNWQGGRVEINTYTYIYIERELSWVALETWDR
jgi:hypothetical protein